MIGQSRHDRKLLRTVRGKPHATQADHEDALPTPPGTNSTRSSGSHSKAGTKDVDTDADPLSSDDEDRQAQFELPSLVDDARDDPPKAKWAAPPARWRATDTELKKPQLKMPSVPTFSSPVSTGSKRSSESEASSDDILFSSQPTKRAKTAGPKTLATNMHAPARRSKQVYGRGSSQVKTSSSKGFKKPAKPKTDDEPKKATFRKASALEDMHRLGAEQPHATFTTPDDTTNLDPTGSLSPSLSSLSSVPNSPDVEEIQQFQLPTARPYCAMATCDICGASVPQSMKEQFENDYTDGKAMSFKWQQRFCRHHQQATAKEAWKEKGYPTIDWAGLKERMCRFDAHLRDVIRDRVASSWRKDLQRDLAAPGKKNKLVDAKAAANEGEVKTMAWTGYYGPKGEKVMTEHVLANLSTDLRERASKDRMVATSGVKGGVSGFVHGVLVPELACRLVAEDLGVSLEEARRVVEESSADGVLLNAEGDEEVSGLGLAAGEGDEMEE